MGIYVASQVIKLMIKNGYKVDGARVLVLGITFKENCPDIRNSRVIDVVRELQEYGCNIIVSDYWADKDEVKKEYDLELKDNINYNDYSAIILAVAHNKFKSIKLDNGKQVVFDIKSILDNSDGKL
jgi:UDP-N-acetyl-D-galactosamine dehydrogenase